MSLANLSKKKKENEVSIGDFELTDANADLKITAQEDHRFRIKGASGYETAFLKKAFTEGNFLIHLEDLSRVTKKTNPKACFRLGVFCQTEDDKDKAHLKAYCLGSQEHSIALRSNDLSIIQGGKVRLGHNTPKVNPSKPQAKAAHESPLLNSPSHGIPAQSSLQLQPCHGTSAPTQSPQDSYYLLLCLRNPKNPSILKHHKNRGDNSRELLYSSSSFIAFFKGGNLIGAVKGLREGTYFIGVSLYMEATVQIDLGIGSGASPGDELLANELEGAESGLGTPENNGGLASEKAFRELFEASKTACVQKANAEEMMMEKLDESEMTLGELQSIVSSMKFHYVLS